MTTYAGAEEQNKSPLFTILGSDGTLRLQVPEGTEGAVRREYELKDGTKSAKIEKVFKSIEGSIYKLDIHDGDYGTSIVLELKNNEGQHARVALSMNTNFGEDFAKKLPNVNLEKPVKLTPYSFEADGKQKRGVTVEQDGEKIQSFFTGYDEKKKEFLYMNGYPQPKGDVSKYTKDKWKVYFGECRIFLQEYIEKMIAETPVLRGFTEVVDDVQVVADDDTF